ncbi:MAG: Holliday junction resolvase-like protein [Thermoproteota archaeon]
MDHKKEAKDIIRTLEENRFYGVCPCCGESFLLRDAGLFYLDDFSPEAEELYQQKLQECKAHEKEIREERKKITQRSLKATTTINIGFILERLAPTMKGFRFDRNDCRSLFDPIDYLIFEGLSRKNSVTKILFTEIKTGRSSLNRHQREIRDLVRGKKVAWDTYRRE